LIKRNRKAFIIYIVIVILLAVSVRLFTLQDHTVFANDITMSQLLDYKQNDEIPSYAMIKKEIESVHSTSEAASEMKAESFTLKSDDIQIEVKTEGGMKALYWNDDKGWLEWDFTIAEDGLYNLALEYLPLKGGYSAIVRGLQIDGAYPFKEAAHMALDRYWKDSKFPYDRNEIGQEVRPIQEEITGWKSKFIADYEVSSEPLQFHLTKGSHKLRLIGVKEPIALKGLTWKTLQKLVTYNDYRKTHQDSAGKPWYQVVEAERFLQKSNTSIQTAAGSEPYISPDPKGRIVYNTLGGARWRVPGEWVDWEFDVPEEGWYELDLKYFQGLKGKAVSFRTIMLDGAVPFQEMLHYSIAANDNFQIRSIQDNNKKPYQFYLSKGTHTLRMIVDASPVQPAQLALQHTLVNLTELEHGIRLITGINGQGAKATALNLDINRTWDIRRYDPNVDKKIQRLITEFQSVAAYLDGLNQHKTDVTYAIAVAIDMLQRFAGNVNNIPNKMDDFAIIQNNINTWLAQMNYQPVLLDYLVVRKPDTKTGLKEPSVLSRIPYNTINFFRSFYLAYDTHKLNKDTAITVWVQRGRDYAELLRQMVDQDFTPRTGIHVNINLMPNPNQLILGNAAGKQPDIALGMATETPADYAMRDAVLDLSKFKDYKTVSERFNPGAMRSFAYNGGTYALPEVQNFLVLFYRTDILEQLKLKVPDTWDDVYAMLPTLQENGKTMYYPTRDFLPFFYQNNANFYSPDGLRATLDSDAAIKGFKQWTDMYTKYSLPLETPVFFNHFREGDMPIGIADYNTYIQLQVAAPEITGHWKIAPVPGNKQANGEITRWTSQPVSSALIMKKSKKQEQAWEFLKWWTSDDIQSQYGNDIESYYGLEFRWNTANINALSSMAWSSEDLEVIKEQSRWVKNMPYVPGFYYLLREMDFAWSRTVLQGIPAIESLRISHVELQREMTRRQNSFGISTSDNLHIPDSDQPFDGGVKQ
jgi:ABC-type glycerol-3-phosphate transport system substrate-binding protein